MLSQEDLPDSFDSEVGTFLDFPYYYSSSLVSHFAIALNFSYCQKKTLNDMSRKVLIFEILKILVLHKK